MNRKLSILAVLAIAAVCQIMANPVTPAQAEQLARTFVGQRTSTVKKVALKRASVASSTVSANATQPYYIFNADGNQGFVIVSGEDRFANVIAYSDSGHFSMDNAPASLQSWMALYARYVEAYWRNDSLTAGTPARAAAGVVVEPLLGDITWGQDAPFNEKCPTYADGTSTVHYYTGCVAAAATQIMRYYKYPTRGTGEKSCTIKGIDLSANFGETQYDWDNMLTNYPRGGTFTTAQRDAVATLAAHFGVAVEMEYEKAGSGASPMMVPGALKNYFGYDRHVTLRKRDYYSTSEWMNIIKSELDAGRPVYYGGASDAGTGGHAFVCDGYDENGYVHINWGWYGSSNGYFLINRLNPSDLGEGGGTGGYNRDQEMVTGIQPSSTDASDVELPLYGSVRLSITPYGGNVFTLMTILENLDTDEFNGALAAVITQNGEIKKVLKQEALTVKGYAGSVSGTAYITMRDITATAEGLSDGEYEIRFAYKSNDGSAWHVIRHYTGYPRYVEMTVSNGQVILGQAHVATPQVTLTAPLTCTNEIHAGGAALFKVALCNNSKDVRLNGIVVKLTSVDNPARIVTGKATASVYEESDYSTSVLVTLPDTVTPGRYQVTAYADGYAQYTFDDSEVGRTEVEILEKTTQPILGVTQTIEWSGSAGTTTLKQGDMLMLGFAVRNYGAAGNAAVVTRLQDVNNPERSYVLRQTASTAFAQGEQQTFSLGRYLNVDAGTYTITVTAVADDGTALAIAQPDEKTTVTIEPDDQLVMTVKSLTLDDVLSPGKKTTCQLVVHLNQDYSNYIYLRLRQFTNSGGELLLMKRISNGMAGQDITFDFNYTPTVAIGTYMPMVEYKSGSGAYVGANGLGNYYREVRVVDATGIDANPAEEAKPVTLTADNGVITVNAATGVSVSKVVVTAVSGAVVWRGAERMIDLKAMPNGIYLISVYTDKGTFTHKICR